MKKKNREEKVSKRELRKQETSSARSDRVQSLVNQNQETLPVDTKKKRNKKEPKIKKNKKETKNEIVLDKDELPEEIKTLKKKKIVSVEETKDAMIYTVRDESTSGKIAKLVTDPESKLRKGLDFFGIKLSNKEKYVQDFIGIKDVKYGIVETTSGDYVKILEVIPINFNLKEDSEKDDIIHQFGGVLKSITRTMQFKSITKRVDSERYVDLMRVKMEKETNVETREMTEAYIDLIQEISAQEALTRRFFVIFKYEKERNSDSHNYNYIRKELTVKAEQISKYLTACGNEVIQYDDINAENKAITEFLYIFLNKKSSQTQSFKKRYTKILKDKMIVQGRSEQNRRIAQELPIIDLISPRGIDLNHVNHMIMDGMYYNFLLIKSNGYNDSVVGGWTQTFVNLGDGIDVDIFLTKEDKSKSIDRIRRSGRDNKIRMKEVSANTNAYDESEEAVMSSEYIVNALVSGGDDLHFMSTMITITAPTLELLRDKTRRVKDHLKNMNYQLMDLPFRQERALKSTMPLCNMDKILFELSKQNVVTRDAASTYMFTSFEMSDDSGILLGTNKQNNTLCIVNIFNSDLYNNANIAILGASGKGKTFAEQLIALRMRMQGHQVMIITPDKGHEWKAACDEIGGTFVSINPSSPDCINPMEIRRSGADIYAAMDMNTLNDSKLLAKIDQLKIFFGIINSEAGSNGKLSIQEDAIIDMALVETYKKFGITEDNDSLLSEDGVTYKKMPLLEDVYEQLEAIGKKERRFKSITDSLGLTLSRFIKSGSMSGFNKHTNVDLENKYIVFDIEKISENQGVGMFIILDYCWDKIKEDRSKEKALFIDETWRLISLNELSANYVVQIFKTIRGYGGAAIAATQDITDFYTLKEGFYGKAIINNSATKILLGMEKDGADVVTDILGLTNSERRALMSFDRGEALFFSSRNKAEIKIKASEYERLLISTKREDSEKKLSIKRDANK